MKTVRLSMAQALLRFLSQQYIAIDEQEHNFVKGVFGIFGHGNVTGLGEALQYAHHGLPFIRANNEQGMVHAATAFAKQSRRLAIYTCTSSIGPGATNMITGAATATANRIPVLLLPGDVFACRQPDPVLQQIENPSDYTETVNDAFKPVSRYWDRINRPEQLMTACLNAMRVLTDPVDTGAVTLCLPQDVQAEVFEYPESFFAKRVWRIERRQPDEKVLADAVSLLKTAKNPLIIAGGGVRYSLAEQALQAFADQHKIPVAETQAGKSSMPWDHVMSVGGVGVTGTLAANTVCQQADVIIALGTRLQDFTTQSKWQFGDQAKIIAINVSRQDGLKSDALCLTADAQCGLSALSQQLADYTTPPAYQSEVAALKKNWNDEVDRLYTIRPEQSNSQLNILGVLNQQMQTNDVVVCAAGSLPGDLHRLWRCQQPGDYHVEYAYSCMGYEVSGGLGVKLAQVDGEVFVVVGDGSFLMLHSELLTSIQEKIKINIIVLDNSGFQCIKNLQVSQGADSFGNERYAPVDFEQYARALGVNAWQAEDCDQLQELLQHARSSDKSTLITMNVLPDSMSNGYESWWRVDVSEVSNQSRVVAAHQSQQQKLSDIKMY
ncbi:MAG: 3D-(3,5/4)-trihydroxycyclohexane-1,2-dione acylhydrolase (decyclizing) [Coxiellaceae bacterium]|nr:3D-(3,5/4)-trihydroxycyclohexane-1,2-dione acylhydrolase (decyclizing) [Coxiellaceae bacterium]